MSSLFPHSNYSGQNNFNWALSLQKYLLNQNADYGFVYAVCPGGEGAALKAVDSKGFAGSNPVDGANLNFVYLSAELNSNG